MLHGAGAHDVAVGDAAHEIHGEDLLGDFDGALGADGLAAAAFHAVARAMLHAEGAVGVGELRQGAGGAEHGAHLAGGARIGVDDDVAPQARVHHDVFRLAQSSQAIEQALAAVGDEMRQGAVVHYFKVAAHIASIGRRRGPSIRVTGIAQRLSHRRFRYDCPGTGGQRGAFREHGAAAAVVIGHLLGRGRQLAREAHSHGRAPNFQQLLSGFHHRLGARAAPLVLAALAIAVDEHHLARAFHGKIGQKRLVHAAEAFHTRDLLFIVAAARPLQKLAATEIGHALVGRTRCAGRRHESDVAGMMGLQGAGGAHRGAGAAADALLGRHGERLAVVGNTARRAGLGAAQTVGVTVAHKRAPLLVHGDVRAFQLPDESQHSVDARHDSPLRPRCVSTGTATRSPCPNHCGTKAARRSTLGVFVIIKAIS